MIGALPEVATRYRVEGEATIAEPFSPRAPEAGEVVIAVAGSAVGAAPGREVAGVVVAADEGAAEWIGRRVVVPRVLPCGECDRCRRARTAACRRPAPRGGPATVETVPARYLLSVEPPLWPEGAELWQLAALADAAALPYGALVRVGVAPGDVVAVIGGGVRGRLAARLAMAKGAIAALVEPNIASRDAARAAGIDPMLPILDGNEPAPALLDRLRGLAHERGAAAFELKVVETTGSAAGRGRALELAALSGGAAVLLADGDGAEVTVALDVVAESEARISGAAACHPDLLPELAALVRRGDLALDREVTAMPFTRLAEALDARRTGRADTLAVLAPEQPPVVPVPGAAAPIDTAGSARS